MDDDGQAECFSSKVSKARKKYECYECGNKISAGDKYEYTSGMWEGDWSTFRTCLSCVEIRNHFSCGGWIYGRLWEDLENNFFPTMTAGGPCMDGLSPEAKGRLFEKRMTWYEETNS